MTSQILSGSERLSFAKKNPSTWQVCHINMLIKQHDWCTGLLWTGQNKKPLSNVRLYHTGQWHRCVPPELLALSWMFISHFLSNVCKDLAAWLQTACTHISTGPPHPIARLYLHDCLRPATLLVHKRKDSYKLPGSVLVKFICILVVLTRAFTWLQFIMITNFSRQMLTSDCVLLFWQALSS